MPKPDWYSRIVLTAIAGLLLVVAGELRLSRQLVAAATASQNGYSASYPTLAYAPRPVALRHPSPAPAQASNVQPVRIVGYQYQQDGYTKHMDFGNGYGQALGLPIIPHNK